MRHQTPFERMQRSPCREEIGGKENERKKKEKGKIHTLFYERSN
jgi:hypothetical protein